MGHVKWEDEAPKEEVMRCGEEDVLSEVGRVGWVCY